VRVRTTVLALLRPAACALLAFTGLLGVAYPAVIAAMAAWIPGPAPGELVGQPVVDPRYFHGRPSAVAYDARTSGGTNLGPSGFVDARGALGPHPALRAAVEARVEALRAAPGDHQPVPVDLVTSSGSGLDPDITPAAAYYQVPRIAHLRGCAAAVVGRLRTGKIAAPALRVLGARRVNVVRLNRALDRELGRPTD